MSLNAKHLPPIIPYSKVNSFFGCLCMQRTALPHLSVVKDNDMRESAWPISSIATPQMQTIVRQHVQSQLQQLGMQLDAALATTYRSLGLALCILAATASSAQELQAAERHFEIGKDMLNRLVRSLRRTDVNTAAAQHVKYLETVIRTILNRKQELLSKLQRAEHLLQLAALRTDRAVAPEHKQQLAGAMAAVSRSHDAEVRFGQLPDGQLFVTPSSVLVDFGAQLTGAAPQQRHLKILNKTTAPLALQLVDSSLASSSGSNGSSTVQLPGVLKVQRKQLLVAPDRAADVEVIADTCADAGSASAMYLVSTQASSSCPPVQLSIQAEYQHLAVEIDTAAVNFGTVPTYHQAAKRIVRVSNSTGVAVRIKSSVQLPYGIRSKLTVQPNSFALQPYEDSYPLTLLLHPSSSSEMIQGVEMVVAAGSASYARKVLVTADIQQPDLQLRLRGGTDPIVPNEVLHIAALQPGQEEQMQFELINKGEGLINRMLPLHGSVLQAMHCAPVLSQGIRQ